jgi:uncharacterized membrane protein YfcA
VKSVDIASRPTTPGSSRLRRVLNKNIQGEVMLADYATIVAVLLVAYFVRGLTGFGSGLISVPLLALNQPLQIIVPLVMMLDFIASFILGGVNTKQTDWSEIKRLLPFGVVGASFGVFALIRFPSSPILVSLGIFTIIFGIRNALGMQPKGHISALWAVPTGLIGSGAGALFGTSAPPYIIYLTHRLPDKTAVRATFSWLFVLDGGFRLILFVASGLLLQRKTQNAIAVGLLPMIVGLYLGNKVHVNITRDRMLQVIGWILVGSGASLILKVMLK